MLICDIGPPKSKQFVLQSVLGLQGWAKSKDFLSRLNYNKTNSLIGNKTVYRQTAWKHHASLPQLSLLHYITQRCEYKEAGCSSTWTNLMWNSCCRGSTVSWINPTTKDSVTFTISPPGLYFITKTTWENKVNHETWTISAILNAHI